MSSQQLVNGLGSLLADLVLIPAGRVVIGSSESAVAQELRDLPGVRSEWLRKEVPRRTVVVPAFAIGRTPVTVAQAEALRPWTGVSPVRSGGPEHPADLGVAGSFQFCAAVSDLTGRWVRPPSEVQWVRAARGDDDRRYPWGDIWDSGRANLVDEGLEATCPVGSYPSGASPYGVLDLVGNADELTSTVYRPFPGAPLGVPLTESWSRSPFVTKGGGFMHARDLARVDRRHGIYADDEPLALRICVTTESYVHDPAG